MLKTLDDLRRFTIARNFFPPTTLKRALHKMGFVQADPIRAPARAQDLILRHRVNNYHAGDLERRYATLDIEEDFFVVYGFVTKSLHALMHPRSLEREIGEKGKGQESKTQLLLEFVRARGTVHPREVDEHFAHGKVQNYWGGSSNATTRLLEAMHYRGLLSVARRENGIRIYSVREHKLRSQTDARASAARPTSPGSARHEPSTDQVRDSEVAARVDTLVDVAVRLYAPLPGPSLSFLLNQLRYAAPQWRAEFKNALQRAKQRFTNAQIDGVDWYWPANENAARRANSGAGRALGHHFPATEDRVRLLAPFDPVVRDRTRFELLWGWAYRFEAYTPVHKRKLGYYALPLLWRDRVIGWANLAAKNGELNAEFGYVGAEPRDRAFKRELAAELDRMRAFLGLSS